MTLGDDLFFCFGRLSFFDRLNEEVIETHDLTFFVAITCFADW
jgi:hypothetical protein